MFVSYLGTDHPVHVCCLLFDGLSDLKKITVSSSYSWVPYPQIQPTVDHVVLFMICGWLCLQMWNLWVWRVDYGA